jgi:hypothetical protein
MLAWKGLSDYGYNDIATRLAYRWLYTVVKAFADFNGVVPEKFDVVGMTHLVNVVSIYYFFLYIIFSLNISLIGIWKCWNRFQICCKRGFRMDEC